MIPYEKRGCVISLDNSWRITVVVRPKILTSSTTYTMFFNNISVIFQQKEGESLTYDTPSFFNELIKNQIISFSIRHLLQSSEQ